MKFAVAGSGEYLRVGVEYLKEYGYSPTVVEHPEDAPAHLRLLICLAYPRILRRPTLDRFPDGCINFHCGLPDYRGRHPLQWMLIDGVQRIPCATHYMDEDIDTGDIIEESSVPVDRNETYDSALAKVLSQVGPLLVATLWRIKKDQVLRKRQPVGRHWPPRTPIDSAIDFDQPSARVHRFINAMSDPMPNAYCEMAERRWTFKRSFIGEKPGRILDTTQSGRYVIATADGVVLVERA